MAALGRDFCAKMRCRLEMDQLSTCHSRQLIDTDTAMENGRSIDHPQDLAIADVLSSNTGGSINSWIYHELWLVVS